MHSWVHRNRRRLEAIYGLRGSAVARARSLAAPDGLAGLLDSAAAALGRTGARLRVHVLVPARVPRARNRPSVDR